jgi:hypothetical protein
MPDNFDPYLEWLGIKSGGRSPDHYRLLRLKPFESDPALIARAADTAMARVRNVLPGQHQAQWSQVLDRLKAAKACLLDPAHKKAYDERLEAARQARASAPAVERIVIKPIADEPPTPWLGKGALVAGLIALGVVVVGGLVYSMCQPSQSTVTQELARNADSESTAAQASTDSDRIAPPKPPLPPPPKRPPKPPAPPPRPALPPKKGPEAAKPPAEQPKPKPDLDAAKPPVNDPNSDKPSAKELKPAREAAKPSAERPKPIGEVKLTPAVAEAAANIRVALAKRNLPAAREQLKIATAAAHTSPDLDQVDRLDTMLEHLSQFWDGIQTALEKLQAAEEIVILKERDRIVVVDSGRDFLTVKVAGRVHHFRLATLPTSIVTALAEQSFGKDPGSQAVIGTFLAVDPRGNRLRARQYWQDAARAGLDTEKLLPELDLLPPARK